MKFFWIPTTLLALILAFSLGNNCRMAGLVDEWTRELDEVQLLSSSEAWQESAQKLNHAYSAWQSHQTYLHIVCVHDAVDNAESLFQRCLMLCQDRDAPEFHSNMAELISQLKLLAEMEKISIKNIL